MLRRLLSVLTGAALVLAASLIALPVQADAPALPGGDEPRTITGSYESTNTLLPLLNSEIGIVLVDITHDIHQDYDAIEPPAGQVLGTIEGNASHGTYEIVLPDTPQGLFNDFDGDDTTPPAVQVFATATYINFFGDEYIERGEGIIDPSVRLEPMTYNFVGGHVVVWTAHGGELFPGSFGADGAAFTADDDLMTLPAGWSVISLETDPFTLIRQPVVDMPLYENSGALNDYSAMSFTDAWEALFNRMKETYPFTDAKHLDWDQIYAALTPRVEAAQSVTEFHLAINGLSEFIPDSHLNFSSIPLIQSQIMGSLGITDVGITDDERVIVVEVSDEGAAKQVGLSAGAELIAVNGVPTLQYLDETPMLLFSASTPHAQRDWQSMLMLLGPPGDALELTWIDAAGTEQTRTLTYEMDPATLLDLLGGNALLGPTIQGEMLDSGLGYISIANFFRNASAFDATFSAEIEQLVEAGATGIIIDVRGNPGGLAALPMTTAGHFFPDYARLIDFHYADGSGEFVYRGFMEILALEPYYTGPVAVLVDENTGSAGELFAYALQMDQRGVVVGHTPTSGGTGEVSDGQYILPGDLEMQVPTGRITDPVTGEIIIEGIGVIPDIRVPITTESLLSPDDEVLQAAEAALLGQ